MHIILACDNQDADLGTFFQQCATDMEQYIKKNTSFTLVTVDSTILSRQTIENQISSLNGESFLFLAYSHGTPDSLCCDKSCVNPYVKASNNAYYFNQSFFYTFSCETGLDLAEALSKNNLFSFVGYVDKVRGNNEDMMLDLVECVNYGIKLFLQGHDSWQVIGKMWEKYTEYLTKWLKIDEDRAGQVFRRNRDALEHRGQRLTLAELQK